MAALSARRRAPGARAFATSSSHNAHPPPSYPPGGAADGSGTAAAVAAAGLLRPTPQLHSNGYKPQAAYSRNFFEVLSPCDTLTWTGIIRSEPRISK